MTDIAKHLHVGQIVRIETINFGYHIVPVTGQQPGVEVVSIGPDFLVVNDAESGVRTRIPNHYLTFAEVPAENAAEIIPQAA
jgi:hypothetical protein